MHQTLNKKVILSEYYNSNLILNCSAENKADDLQSQNLSTKAVCGWLAYICHFHLSPSAANLSKFLGCKAFLICCTSIPLVEDSMRGPSEKVLLCCTDSENHKILRSNNQSNKYFIGAT